MKFLFTYMYNVSGYRVTGMVREKQKDWENLLLSFVLLIFEQNFRMIVSMAITMSLFTCFP